jgi:hypothetical protein
MRLTMGKVYSFIFLNKFVIFMTFGEFLTSLLELVSLVSASLLFMATTLLIYCRWSVLLTSLLC